MRVIEVNELIYNLLYRDLLNSFAWDQYSLANNLFIPPIEGKGIRFISSIVLSSSERILVAITPIRNE